MSICIEKKTALSGRVDLFTCELLFLERDFGILKYVVDREYRVHNSTLLPGDITYGFYWSSRPYTLYVWPRKGAGAIYYFNVADSITLSHREFAWRDLVVDVVVESDLNAVVLDENELPDSLSPELRTAIFSGRDTVLNTYRRIIEEVKSVCSGASTGNHPLAPFPLRF
jgi:hypothetical protein